MEEVSGVWRMDGKAVKAVLGKNIKLQRTKKGLTQAVLAEKAEISVIFLSSIERGTKYPKAETVARLALELEVEVFELFRGDLVPFDSKELIRSLSVDLSSKLNSALDAIFEQYLG